MASSAITQTTNPNAFAIQFVQKYLATVDAQNAAAGSGSNSYVVQLFQGSQSLDQTIGNAMASGALSSGGLNVLA